MDDHDHLLGLLALKTGFIHETQLTEARAKAIDENHSVLER